MPGPAEHPVHIAEIIRRIEYVSMTCELITQSNEASLNGSANAEPWTHGI